MDLREIAAPHLRQLSDETQHTVNLAILDGVDVVTIDRCRGARPGEREIDFDLDLRVGARLPAYCTAVGKAMLAFVAEPRREEIIEQIDFVARGPNTLIDPAAFRAELARIRVSGVAINDEELAYGLRSIAAPIHSHSGEVLAALNLAVHRTMVTMEELIERFGPAVLRAAQGVSRSMGQQGGSDGMSESVTVLWTPPADVRETTEVGRFLTWLERERGLAFEDYAALQRWSVEDLPAFWGSIWDFFEVKAHAPYTTVLASDAMPGAVWFPGATAQLRRAPGRE